MIRAVVVEDGIGHGTSLARCLTTDDLSVTELPTGCDARRCVRERTVHVVLLDAQLSNGGGPEFCRLLRDDGYTGGIILFAGQSSELDRVFGLDAGADDYFSGTLGVAETRARVRAVLRRIERLSVVSDGCEVAGLSISLTQPFATYEGAIIALGRREHLLLKALYSDAGRVVSNPNLAELVWADQRATSIPTVSIAIARLRKKLSESGVPLDVVNVRGCGYRLVAVP